MEQDPNYLTPEQESVLEFENRGQWRWQGAKESAVREQLGMNLTRYHQVLNAAIDKWDAGMKFPHTVNRLRRLRAQRAAERSAS